MLGSPEPKHVKHPGSGKGVILTKKGPINTSDPVTLQMLWKGGPYDRLLWGDFHPSYPSIFGHFQRIVFRFYLDPICPSCMEPTKEPSLEMSCAWQPIPEIPDPDLEKKNGRPSNQRQPISQPKVTIMFNWWFGYPKVTLIESRDLS